MAFSTIIKPSDYFNPKIWSGNSSTQAITGIGFAPDMVWGKQRTGTESHQLLDIIRGANNILIPNTVAAALADSQILNSFDSDGYTLGSQNQLNDTGYNYVGWNWKANGLGSSNTDGSINTTYTSANTTSKCSIVKWVGTGANATVGHGLGVAPSSVWVKNLNEGEDWTVWHKGLAGTHYLVLNSTAGDANGGAGPWNSTIPDANVFSLGTWNSTNKASSNMIAYVFADVQGYSKINRYSGNGNADGSFIYTGHKPAFVMIKCASHPSLEWNIWDNKRSTFNVADKVLWANTNNTEAEIAYDYKIDMLSNGFKVRTADSRLNANGYNYFYWSFAEEPLVSTNGQPATAR